MLGYKYLCNIYNFDRTVNNNIRILKRLFIKACEKINYLNLLKELFNNSIEMNLDLPNDFFEKIDTIKINLRNLVNKINRYYEPIKEYVDEDFKRRILFYINELNNGIAYKVKIFKIPCSICRQNNNYVETTLDKDICPICINHDDKIFCKLNFCNHIYHLECIKDLASYKNIDLIIKYHI